MALDLYSPQRFPLKPNAVFTKKCSIYTKSHLGCPTFTKIPTTHSVSLRLFRVLFNAVMPTAKLNRL